MLNVPETGLRGLSGCRSGDRVNPYKKECGGLTKVEYRRRILRGGYLLKGSHVHVSMVM